MNLGIPITVGILLFSTAVVLWLATRAPIIEECDCKECRAGRRRSSRGLPQPSMSRDSGGKGIPRPGNAASDRKSTRRKARMMPVDHRARRAIFGPSEHAGPSS